ncbi:MAG: XdhC family protein [Acidobacteriota bacterium]
MITVISQSGEVRRKLIDRAIVEETIKQLPSTGISKANNLESLYLKDFDFFLLSDVVGVETIVEFIGFPVNLFIFGAGHVGKAVAEIAVKLGYTVHLLDDREEFLNTFSEGDIQTHLIDFNDLNIEMSADDVVVIVTRGHWYDELCLSFAIKQSPRYLGMIGSKRRVLGIKNRLIEEGISKVRLDQVQAPIGLKINAKTPMEIAISILAEIIQVINSKERKLCHLKD